MNRTLSAAELKQQYWGAQRSVPEIAKRIGVSTNSLYHLMRTHHIPRRDGTESNYVTGKRKPRFVIKTSLTTAEQRLKIAGIMLYWAEGAQTGTVVDFTNSNPDMVRLFLRFLRDICGVNESRLRVYLYHHGTPEAVETSKRFWRRLTHIPLAQFSRPYIRHGNPHRSRRVILHGVVHIRYSDKRLLETIHQWIAKYVCASSHGQVPEWPNGAACKAAGLRLRRFEPSPAHHSLRVASRMNDLKRSDATLF